MRKKRGSSRYYIFFMFILILLVSAFIGIKHLVQNVPFFSIKAVNIKGNVNLETEFLTNISKDFIGQNLFKVSETDVLEKYHNINRISDITVARKFPNKLVIKIEEKTGYFYIKTIEGELFPITKNREILSNNQLFESEVLPIIDTKISEQDFEIGEVISSDWITEVYTTAKILAQIDLFDDISEYYIVKDELVMVQNPIGYRIIPGKGEIKEKMKRYKFIRDNRSFEKESFIDLRFDDKLVVRAGV